VNRRGARCVASGAALLALGASYAGALTRVVAWGDSMTYGFYDGTSAANDCTNGSNGNPPETCGYPGRLGSRLNDSALFSPIYDVEMLNLGKGGENTVGALSRIGIQVGSEPVCPCTGLASPCANDSLWFWYCNGMVVPHDLFVIMEGTNDITRQEISLETVRANLQALGEKAASLDLNVVLSTITPRHPDGFTRDAGCADDGDGDAVILNALITNTAANKGWPRPDPYGFLIPLPSLFSVYYQNWDPMKCNGLVEREQGDPVGHLNALGYDKVSFGTDNGNHAKTFLSVVRSALPPRLTLHLPSPPLVQGAQLAFSATLHDVVEFGQTVVLTWDFGDGTTVQQQTSASPATQEHAFAEDGTYLIRVSARHANGGTNTVEAELTIGGGSVQGDIDDSGRVDGADLVVLALAFGSQKGQERFDAAADLDHDDRVDGDDLAILAANFGLSVS
jgi:lysophospholipase L1-like esterase